MRWTKAVERNLLPLSVGNKLPEAFREWRYQDVVKDLVEEDGELGHCEMCDHEDVRWHFLIRNVHTDRTLWTGSVCILKFPVEVYDEKGRLLAVLQAKDRKLGRDKAKVIAETRYRKTKQTLEQLAAKEPKLSSMVEYFGRREALTPNQVALIVWRCRANDLEVDPSAFKVALRRDREKAQVKSMPLWKLQQIWKALSAQQRQRIRSWRDDLGDTEG